MKRLAAISPGSTNDCPGATLPWQPNGDWFRPASGTRLNANCRATVLRDELDTRVFPLVLDFGEGLNGPSDRAIAAFFALNGGQVDTGLLGTLMRRPTPDRTQHANLFRSQHALAEFHQNGANLQVQSKSVQES